MSEISPKSEYLYQNFVAKMLFHGEIFTFWESTFWKFILAEFQCCFRIFVEMLCTFRKWLKSFTGVQFVLYKTWWKALRQGVSAVRLPLNLLFLIDSIRFQKGWGDWEHHSNRQHSNIVLFLIWKISYLEKHQKKAISCYQIFTFYFPLGRRSYLK